MTSVEKLMLLDIHSLVDVVPNFRNNLDMAGYSSFRSDSLQLQHYLKSLTYSLLLYTDHSEDKTSWKSTFNETLSEAKSFVVHRKSEEWGSHSTFQYTVAIVGW